MKTKLPRLNSYVYVITYVDSKPHCISRDIVYMKNKDSFIVEDMMSNAVIEEYRIPLDISDYGERYTYTLKEAKEVVRKWAKEQGYDFDIKKTCDNSWNIDIIRNNGTLM